VVGLELNPPDAAVVLCADEKSGIQALDRTAPVLPLLPGVARRRSHDYAGHGPTNLYPALEVASGKVISQMTRRHRAIECKQFLARIDQAVPGELDVHLIVENSSTHKRPAIQRWLVAHPRFHGHFTHLQLVVELVERWFAELTNKGLRRGTTARWVSSLPRSRPGSTPGTRSLARCVDQDRRPDPREHHSVSPANL
jgi:hypothetical protein